MIAFRPRMMSCAFDMPEAQRMHECDFTRQPCEVFVSRSAYLVVNIRQFRKPKWSICLRRCRHFASSR